MNDLIVTWSIMVFSMTFFVLVLSCSFKPKGFADWQIGFGVGFGMIWGTLLVINITGRFDLIPGVAGMIMVGLAQLLVSPQMTKRPPP